MAVQSPYMTPSICSLQENHEIRSAKQLVNSVFGTSLKEDFREGQEMEYGGMIKL